MNFPNIKDYVISDNFLKTNKNKIFIMRTFSCLKNRSIPYFDIIKRLEKLETQDNKTKELLGSVVQVINSMQELQYEAKDKTKKIGFLRE